MNSGHIAAPPPTIKEETIPDSIKRTFSTADLEDGEKEADVDIAILDTGIDLHDPDLNVYRNVSFVRGADTGDDDNGHGRMLQVSQQPRITKKVSLVVLQERDCGL